MWASVKLRQPSLGVGEDLFDLQHILFPSNLEQPQDLLVEQKEGKRGEKPEETARRLPSSAALGYRV